jgi:hydroxymethylbilane synthase
MLPAPGQGAIAIVCRQNDKSTLNKITAVNHEATMITVHAERDFLHELKGGCSAPISAHAILNGDSMTFKGSVHSLDGTRSYEVTRVFAKSDLLNAGRDCAREMLQAPEGRGILEEIFRVRPELKG